MPTHRSPQRLAKSKVTVAATSAEYQAAPDIRQEDAQLE